MTEDHQTIEAAILRLRLASHLAVEAHEEDWIILVMGLTNAEKCLIEMYYADPESVEFRQAVWICQALLGSG